MSARAEGLRAGNTAGGGGAWDTASGSGHPAPARDQVSNAALWFGIFAAPAAWSVQTLVNYSLAAHSCYPGLYPRGVPTFGALWWVTLGTSVLAVAVGVAAGLFAYREWTRSRGEVGGSGGGGSADQALQGSQQGGGSGGGGGSATRGTAGDAARRGHGAEPAGAEPANVRAALEIGEGRTRFMAMSGILTSITFVVASVVHGLALFLVQPCGP